MFNKDRVQSRVIEGQNRIDGLPRKTSVFSLALRRAFLPFLMGATAVGLSFGESRTVVAKEGESNVGKTIIVSDSADEGIFSETPVPDPAYGKIDDLRVSLNPSNGGIDIYLRAVCPKNGRNHWTIGLDSSKNILSDNETQQYNIIQNLNIPAISMSEGPHSVGAQLICNWGDSESQSSDEVISNFNWKSGLSYSPSPTNTVFPTAETRPMPITATPNPTILALETSVQLTDRAPLPTSTPQQEYHTNVVGPNCFVQINNKPTPVLIETEPTIYYNSPGVPNRFSATGDCVPALDRTQWIFDGNLVQEKNTWDNIFEWTADSYGYHKLCFIVTPVGGSKDTNRAEDCVALVHGTFDQDNRAILLFCIAGVIVLGGSVYATYRVIKWLFVG